MTVDPKCFDAICTRASLLYRLSMSVASWNASPYGKVLKFTDTFSQVDVRRFWDYYASMSTKSPRALETFTKNFLSDFRKIGEAHPRSIMLTTYRSLGPLFREGSDMISYIIDSLRMTGNVGEKELKPNSRVNPLFVYSSIAYDRCALPGGMTPIAGFHIASAFVDSTPGSVGGLTPYCGNLSAAEKSSRVVTCIKNRFQECCSAFQKTSSIKIYHHTDDVVRFCYSLQSKLDTSADNFYDYCSASWNLPRKLHDFNVAESPYGPFDVIETSSLADEMAVPVLLISVLPLLKKNTDATLYTTNLVPADNTPPDQKLKSLLYCDPLTMFVLLSCVPVEYVSGFSNSSSLHETAPRDTRAAAASSGLVNSEWKFSWKWWMRNDPGTSIPAKPARSTIWNTDAMVKILYDIFQSMFYQDLLGDIDLPTDTIVTAPRCIPGSFVAFVRYLMLHVTAEWKLVIETKFLALLASKQKHSLLMTDYVFQNHNQQITTCEALGLDWAQQNLLHGPASRAVLQGYRDSSPPDGAPIALPYILRVPRSRLRHLIPYVKSTGSKSDVVFQIQFQVEDRPVATFSSFEMTFGVLTTPRPTMLIVDPLGWDGEADLFVHVNLPLSALFAFLRELGSTVSFNIHSIRERQRFRKIYGDRLIVFETTVFDSDHLWSYDTDKIVPTTRISPAPKIETPKVGRVVTGPEITQLQSGPLQMTSRIDIYDAADKIDLINGCEVKFESASPWEIVIQTTRWTVRVAFPFPQDKDTARIRIARKSGWIEVIATIQNYSDVSKPVAVTFPITRNFGSQSTVSWNMPRLVLDALPTLNTVSNSRQRDWLSVHLKSMHSAEEIALLNAGKVENLVKSNYVKYATSVIFSPFHKSNADFAEYLPGVVMLWERFDNSGTARAILFIDNIKLESSADSVVADAYLWPLNPDVIRRCKPLLEPLVEGAQPLSCTLDEFDSFAQYVKCSIERSRQWSHEQSCYANEMFQGSYADKPAALCNCGAGKVSPTFTANKHWAKFAPFVTRFSLSPIFPVPYVNPIGALLGGYFPDQDSSSADEISDVSRQCLLCKSTPDKLKKCGKCGLARYCSRECQRKDWNRHKTQCDS